VENRACVKANNLSKNAAKASSTFGCENAYHYPTRRSNSPTGTTGESFFFQSQMTADERG